MIKPLFDKIVVKLVEEEEKAVNGLIMPNANNDAFQKGKVKATGDDVTKLVFEDDVVIFLKGAGTNIKIDGENYLILLEKDLFGIV